MDYFILINQEVFETDDASVWCEAVDRGAGKDYQIGLSRLKDVDGRTTEISTVFLGQGGQLFETMIFGGIRNGNIFRHQTYREAKEAHDGIVKSIKSARAKHMRGLRGKR